MDWEEFFKAFGKTSVTGSSPLDLFQGVTVEDLYQAFKARFIAEVLSKGFIPMGPA